MLKPVGGRQGNGRSRCLLQSVTSQRERPRTAPEPSDHVSITRERPPTGGTSVWSVPPKNMQS